MDAYSIEIAARWKMDDARRDAELRQLIRTDGARPTSARPGGIGRPSAACAALGAPGGGR